MKINRSAESVINDLIKDVQVGIEELKREPKDDLNFGKMLAYFEFLTMIQCEVIGYEEQFGLDCDIEEKFGLTEYINRKI